MILKYGRFLVIFLAAALLFSGVLQAQSPGFYALHGEIKQVFLEQRKVLISTAGKKLILVLEPDCEILRDGKPTSLQSLRPITATDFQDALFWLNRRGLVSCLWVNYRVSEENGTLQAYNIFGEAK
ncbi:MAG TPA: hypothetical protein GX528_03510 [Firmicutes bacterium]|nr:hypothetical protein [Bacillota bacterium]